MRKQTTFVVKGGKRFNSFLANDNFCHSLINFANSLESDQSQRSFETLIMFLIEFFGEKNDFEKSQQITTA